MNRLVTPQTVMLDFGAGRGRYVDVAPTTLRDLRLFKGKVRRVVAVDVDEAVLQNLYVDEAHAIEPGEKLPFPAETFDLVFAYAVLEHVADPEGVAGELNRVLKPGGLLCAWTPNKWGYVAIASRLIKGKLRKRVLRTHAGMGDDNQRMESDFFPAFYNLNTRAMLKEYFSTVEFEHFSYVYSGPPSYTGGSYLLARLFVFYEWLVPSCMGRNLHIFMRKRGNVSTSAPLGTSPGRRHADVGDGPRE